MLLGAVAIFLTVSLSMLVFAEARLGGSWETFISLETQTTSALIQDSSSSSVSISYEIGGWEFGGDASLTMAEGLSSLVFSADGEFGGITCRSSLTFNPTSVSLTRTPTKVDPAYHRYDFRRLYYIVTVQLVEVYSTTDWYVRVSPDEADWVVVAGPLSSATHSTGVVSVNTSARYVEVVPTAPGTLSPSALEEATIIHAKHVFRTSLRYRTDDKIRISADVTLPNTGEADLRLKLSNSSSDAVSFSADVRFAAKGGDCALAFDKASVKLGLSFCCVEDAKATASFDSGGFNSLKLSVGEISTGFPWLAVKASLKFTTEEKVLTVSPSVSFGETGCITLYSKAVGGASPGSVAGFEFYGIAIECEVGGVEVRSLSYINGTSFAPMAGGQSCWESLSLSIRPEDACCVLQTFDVVVGFSSASAALLDWAETDFSLGLQFSSSLLVTLALAVEQTGLTLLTVAFSSSW